MPHLEATHGHIVDLRRPTNVHLYWRARYGPAERYELWLRDPAGREHQFTIHTRTLPARRGHEVILLADAHAARHRQLVDRNERELSARRSATAVATA
jgi:hypothetical protein